MPRRRCLYGALALAALVGILAAPVSVLASTPTEKVVYSFQGGNDGANPVSDLIADNHGNFYGTTTYGGTGVCTDTESIVVGCGTVFRLTKSQSGEWTETVLYSFQGQPSDSGYPLAGLVMDAAGRLYGTTSGPGPYNSSGTVFELSPPTTKGGAWTKTILYQFQGGYDGASPRSSLIFDNKGQLYGTASIGAPISAGSAFRLTPPSTSGNPWTFTLLYTFNGGDDAQDPSALLFDSKGNLFATSSGGGGESIGGDQYSDEWVGGGTFFELSPGAKGKPWNETIQFAFPPCVYNSFEGGGACGSSTQPMARLIADAYGNLYGTSELGGSSFACSPKNSILGCGSVFQLVPPAVAGGAWTQNILYQFSPSNTLDGALPVGALTLDGSGNLYGTTSDGCDFSIDGNFCFSGGLGMVFELSPPSTQGGAWTETILHQFAGGPDGATPSAGVLMRGSALYTTTQYGGTGNCPHTLQQPAGCGAIVEVIP